MARGIGMAILGLTVASAGCRTRHGAPPAAHVQSAISPAALPAPQKTAAEARAVLVEAARKAAGDPVAQLELALFDRNTGDLHDAQQELVALRAKFPRFARAPYYLGLLYLAHGYEVDALPLLQEAARLAKEDPEAQVNAGLACYQMNRLEEARRYAEAALRLDPHLPEPYLLLARVKDTHGTANESIACLHRYLELSPNPVPGYYLLGRIYARQADGNNSVRWLKRALDAEPNNAEFWLALGRVYYNMFNATRAQEGIQCMEKAVSLDPNDAEAHLVLGRALRDQRQWEAAIGQLQEALRGTRDTGPIYYDLGQALQNAGHKEEARKAFQTYQAYRDYTRAVARFNHAIEAAPRDRSRRYALARFCISQHQYTAAESVLHEAAVQLGPDPTLRQLLDEVNTDRAARAPASAMPQPGSMPGTGSALFSSPLPGAPLPSSGSPFDGR